MTRMPQRPRTTLGTEASISTSAPTGARIQPGASSVRKSAIAIAMGPATSSAKSDVRAVPKMNVPAPKSRVTGFQVVPVTNPSPKVSQESCAPAKTFQVMSPRRITR